MFTEEEFNKLSELALDETYSRDIEVASLKAIVLFNTFGFTWCDNENPKLKDISDTFYYLLRSLRKDGTTVSSTGRLTVMKDVSEGIVDIEFLFNL